MNARFFKIGAVGNGALFIGPRPQAEYLQEWCIAAREFEITHVVSLIEEAEVGSYGLESEGQELAAREIGFTRFPVDDFDVPDEGAFAGLIRDLKARLDGGETLFLHCAGGVGRAGTTASCLLVEHGWDADEAMTHVSAKRGIASPETEGQRAFVRRWKSQ